jgi:hypothetical protein
MAPKLEDALALLSEISRKLDNVIEGQTKLLEMQGAGIERGGKKQKLKIKDDSPPMDVITLLSIPDHLRETAMTLAKIGDATAEQVANETGRTRESESAKLNQLYRMAIVNRRREGRRIIFSPQ